MKAVRVKANSILTELNTGVSYRILKDFVVDIAPDIHCILAAARDQLGTNPLVQVKPQYGGTLLVALDDLELLEVEE